MRTGSLFVPSVGDIAHRKVAVSNISGDTVPIYGLCAAPGGTVDPSSNSRARLKIDFPSGSNDVLFVNGLRELTTTDLYGHAWPVVPGMPLWIAYDNAATPSVGDEWGAVEDSFLLSEDGRGFFILDVDSTNELAWATYQSDDCQYFWEFQMVGGSAKPSSGSQVWSVTIDADTQDVTIPYDMTAAELKTELLSEFSGLGSNDIVTDGGPFPDVALSVEWKTASLKPDWPPVVGTSTLNNSAWMTVNDTPGSR